MKTDRQKEYDKKYYWKNKEGISERHKKYYKDNKEKLLEQKRQYRKSNPEKIRETRNKYNKNKKRYIDNYKLKKGCVVCGYNVCAAALEFHHPNDDKEFNISAGYINLGIEGIKKEMDKCTIFCANCHRELHNAKNL